MSSFLDEERYRDYLARTHPELALSATRLSLPSFVAPLDTREPLLPGLWRRLAAVAHKVAPAQITPACLFLGTPFEPYDQTALLDGVTDAAALVDEVRAAARALRPSVVVMTNVRRDHPQTRALVERGFIAFPSFPDSVLTLDDSFDALLGHRSRARRRNIRRHVHRFERAGHAINRVHDSRAIAPALFQSYRPFFERARVRWFPHSEAYFRDLAALDARVVLSVATDAAGAVTGFVVGFVDDKAGVRTFHSGRVGVHPTYYKRDAVYFRLVYRAIEDAIAMGAQRVSLEPTAYRLKRHLGAEIVPLVNLLLPVSTTWRMLASRAAALGRHALRHLDDDAMLDEHY